MKQILIPVFALSLIAAPLAGQTDDTPAADDGVSLMEEGAKLLLRGLMTEMEPALDDLQDLAAEMGPRMQLLTDQMGPAFAELLGQIDDITQYDAPEFLPNGDIIIRRRDDAPAFVPELAPDIEL